MKRIELEIKALSPLAISRQKPGGSVSECEDYIPGTVIRGAVASEILKQFGQQFANLSENGGHFQALFLGDEPAIFQNAYPANVKAGHGRIFPQNRIKEIKLLPTTALSSKTKSGFCRKKDGEPTTKDKGAFDSLIDRFCAEHYGLPYDPNCPEDGGRVEPYSGFYSKVDGMYYSASASKRLLTRVGINRRRATSEEEILYSIEVLNETEAKTNKPQFFKSSILVPDDLDNLPEKLHHFINNNSKIFRFGGSTSRGLGKVKIDAKLGEIQKNIQDKIEVFNDKLWERWRKWSVFGNSIEELPKRTYFALDLQSDAIFTEKWQRTTVISAQMLKQFTNANIEDESLKLEVAYSSYDYRSGWNAAWGLMKDVELITNKGAVYLFSTTQPDIWYTALADLELKGVGERTCEGFGQVEVCNDFHLVFREEAA
ncbi:type III-D CRISPR-associated RAMP protein Csx10 [Cylindrospermum sp. FACHB-282]|uniref:type III-D CRISPR-associated RAMP protein Csx10 n=1 Tax=Cylindrospermum sp. FACHB-282 TaxID=2692794 RepID=UPI0016839E36|nr:CRISPR-associated RAMP protein Csx10 [Cylindrospermum sp. FACHB-282]MBD2384744.1 CRISPR-associated RAMP protein Csx10 [Cylindrospermum sp. FACHB-282]